MMTRGIPMTWIMGKTAQGIQQVAVNANAGSVNILIVNNGANAGMVDAIQQQIAALPDLIEALRGIRDDYEANSKVLCELVGISDIGSWPKMQTIRDALAKAGEEWT